MEKLSASLLRVQGFYTLLTAIFSIIAIDGFVANAVDTVPIRVYSIVLICAAVVFIDGTRHNKLQPFLFYTPFLFASIMLCIDLYGVFSGMLPSIYLVDAYAQTIFILGWSRLIVQAIGNMIKDKNEDEDRPMPVVPTGSGKADAATDVLNAGAKQKDDKQPVSKS